MKTSYKFWYVTTDTDSKIIKEVAVRFYEGDMSTKDEEDVIDNKIAIIPVTKYRPIKILTKVELPHEGDRKSKKDLRGNDCFIYTDADFGVTTDLDDVRLFLNGVLGNDKDRTPNEHQAEKSDKVKLNLQKHK